MPTGTYNISRLIRELGLKNVAEMPVRESVQPVMPLATMHGQVPVHVGGVAVWGGARTAVVGEFSTFQIQCLDPGGGILQWVKQVGTATLVWELTAASQIWLTGPSTLQRQDFTNNPSPSVAEIGTIAAAGAATLPEMGEQIPNSNFAPLYVPRGSFVRFTQSASNVTLRMCFGWCGITATEGGDA